jgi:hypothetical protein
VRLPAVDLDDEVLVGPDEVDAGLRAVLGDGSGDLVALADAQEGVLQLGLRERLVAEVVLEAARPRARQRVLDLSVDPQPAEPRLLDRAVEPLVIEGVGDVGEGASEAGDPDAVAVGAISMVQVDGVNHDVRTAPGPQASTAAIQRASFVVGQCPAA